MFLYFWYLCHLFQHSYVFELPQFITKCDTFLSQWRNLKAREINSLKRVNLGLLDHDVASLGKCLVVWKTLNHDTLPVSLLIHPSMCILLVPWTLMMKALRFFERSESTQPTIHFHIPESLNTENLRSRVNVNGCAENVDMSYKEGLRVLRCWSKQDDKPIPTFRKSAMHQFQGLKVKESWS